MGCARLVGAAHDRNLDGALAMAWLLGYVAVLLIFLIIPGVIVGLRTHRRRSALIRRAMAVSVKATRWKGLAADGIAVKVAENFSRIGMALVARDGKVLTFEWPTRPWLTGFLLLITFPFGAVYFLAYRFSGGRPVPVSFDISSGEALDEQARTSRRRRAA